MANRPMKRDGGLHAAVGTRPPTWQEQQQCEALCLGTIRADAVKPLLLTLRKTCVGSERELRRWERTLRSSLPDEGLRECRLYTDFPSSDLESSVLRVESPDRVNSSHLAKARDGEQCITARNVTHMPIGASADEWLRSLRFEQTHELLRRGRRFRHETVSISIFQICTRSKAADDWSALDDTEDGLWVVEAIATGAQLKPLVEQIDAWADVFLSKGVALSPPS